jgi:hypothetical protein
MLWSNISGGQPLAEKLAKSSAVRRHLWPEVGWNLFWILFWFRVTKLNRMQSLKSIGHNGTRPANAKVCDILSNYRRFWPKFWQKSKILNF